MYLGVLGNIRGCGTRYCISPRGNCIGEECSIINARFGFSAAFGLCIALYWSC
jgi:hypothetical protein